MLPSTWEWIRLLGFIAYFYFTASIVFGLLRKSTYVKSHKNLLFKLHESAAWFGFVAILAHMLLLIIDQYEPYRMTELLIPFTSDYQPVLSGIGTIAFYLFFAAIITSDIWIRKMKFAIWKRVHIAVLPAWLLSFIHGILIGTDTGNSLILIFYGSTVALVVVVFLLRHMSTQQKKKDKAVNVQPVENQ